MARQKTTVADGPAPAVPLKAKTPEKKAISPFVKYYLFAYNVLSAVGWSYILGLVVIHIFNLDGKSSQIPSVPQATSSFVSRLFSPFLKTTSKLTTTYTLESKLPLSIVPIYRRATTTFGRAGTTTAFVQSFALLEVIHVLLGWVRSPLQTTIMQVSSRLMLVWGIAEQFPAVRSNPAYTSMVFAWSTTEIIRYSFYAFNLLGVEPPILLWLRYTTFYVLYPLGASSEAALIYATLPPLPGNPFALKKWGVQASFRAVLFVIWWPGLYVMYTYMISQRRKVLGSKLSFPTFSRKVKTT